MPGSWRGPPDPVEIFKCETVYLILSSYVASVILAEPGIIRSSQKDYPLARYLPRTPINRGKHRTCPEPYPLNSRCPGIKCTSSGHLFVFNQAVYIEESALMVVPAMGPIDRILWLTRQQVRELHHRHSPTQTTVTGRGRGIIGQADFLTWASIQSC